MEGRVADTILQETQKIVIGGEALEMKPPSIATLILASKYIQQMPKEALDEKHLIPEMIKIAPNLAPVGYALSAMILGVDGFNKLEDRTLYTLGKKRKKQGELLAEKINHADVKEVLSSFFTIIQLMDLSDFFQLTTFLIELNMTKRTKKVVN